MQSVSAEGKSSNVEPAEPEIMAAAEDLIRAIHSKNIHAVAEALKAAVQLIDLAPKGEDLE